MQITEDFSNAFRSCRFGIMPLRVGRASNQAVGNAVSRYLVAQLNQHLVSHRIGSCKGPGYPDQQLVSVDTGVAHAFELKATGRFPRIYDSRVVLTSASRKLRRSFKLPVNHLVGHIQYNRKGPRVFIQTVRLYFLEPDCPVNVRLEAALSQRLLLTMGCVSATFHVGG